jgi:hypothetical protein
MDDKSHAHGFDGGLQLDVYLMGFLFKHETILIRDMHHKLEVCSVDF